MLDTDPATAPPGHHTRPTLRTLILAALISVSVALVVVLFVLLVNPPDPAPSASPADKITTDPPPDLTVRALSAPSPAPDPAQKSTDTQTVLTANLYLAEPGEPLPQPYPQGASPGHDLVPTGQAAIRCTPVARNAITALCDGQALTGYGQLTFAGAMIESDALADPPDADLTFAITGGTGDYEAARGTLSITAYTPTQQDWVFHFTPAPTPN